jgi:serine/threonine protein kinase
MTHPSDEQLRRLLDESLPPPQRAPVEGHVNGCPACLERLEGWLRGPLDDRLLLADLLVQGPQNGHVAAAPETIVEPVAVPPDAPRTIGDHDVLLFMGAGGMGVVYKARHRRLGRLVAIKLLLPGADAQDERRARFLAEAQALARVHHPNVVALYEVGEHEGRPYLALEWADGGTLAARLAGVPQPDQQAAAWIEDLARAIDHVHRLGIVHRDLKPANVLLQKDISRREAESAEEKTGSSPAFSAPSASLREPSSFLLKITDFGVAKCLGESPPRTRCGQALGTPEYMAPEQTGGAEQEGRIGPATDVFALGAMLYEMLTGRPPFRADTPLETLRLVREEEPVAPRLLRPNLPRDLETICLKCLHKEPARRYRSAGELAEDLRRFRAGEPIVARPSGRVERACRWCRRHPSQAALYGLLAAFVLALLTGLLWHIRDDNRREAEHLAAVAERQLPHLQRAVLTAAHDAELGRLVARGDQAALRRHLLGRIEDFRRSFTLPGETQPFMNLFVFDPQGRHRADSYNDIRAGDNPFTGRDYLRYFAAEPAPPRDAVYFSRVYRSVHDGHYKFAVITRLLDGDRCAGFLAASIPLDSKLVGLNMHNERPGAAVAAPVDWSYTVEDDVPRPSHVVLLRRDYRTPGGPPLWPAPDQLACLETFLREPDRQALAQHVTSAGGCADYVRVGQTHFVAVVEKDYPPPLCYLLGPRFRAWGLLALAAVAAAFLACRALRGRC